MLQLWVDIYAVWKLVCKAVWKPKTSHRMLRTMRSCERLLKNLWLLAQTMRSTWVAQDERRSCSKRMIFRLCGTVTIDQIKLTQLAWLKYRDAWVEFGKIRYSKISSNSIAAWFTKKRTHCWNLFWQIDFEILSADFGQSSPVRRHSLCLESLLARLEPLASRADSIGVSPLYI